MFFRKNGKILIMGNLDFMQKARSNFWRSGQSLVEILVGLGVISIMVGASTYALVTVLRSSTVTEQNQSAGLIGNSLLESAFTLAEANWNSIYNLQKTSANHYFLVRSATTTPTPVAGNESVLEQDILNGLVGHWKFDENSGTSAYDSSGNGNLGTLTNGPTRTASASCKVGDCLNFDGAGDYINFASYNSLNNLDKFTLSAWMLMDARKYIPTIINKGPETAAQHIWWGVRSNNQIWLELGDSAGYATYSSSAISWNLGQWYHLAVTFDNTAKEVRHYRDGQLVNIVSTVGKDLNSGTYTMKIGWYWGSSPTNYDFDGSIDDVRIYNRALSATEITQLYNSPVYSRYFYVDNVNRLACGTGAATTTAASSNCNGNANDIGDDPATQKITIGTSWNLKGISEILENSIFVTRWINSAVYQGSWAGSGGVTSAVTDFGTDYFSANGVEVTANGAIKVSSNASSFSATGGTITESGGYRIHTFTTSDQTFTPNSIGNVEVLVVAGGGGGGSGVASINNGGGGGAGGLIYNPSFAVTAKGYPVTVGNGGASDTNGENSVFDTITAVGGGKGGGLSPSVAGGNGGSGGGGAPNGGTAGGIATPSGQGNNGYAGNASSPYQGGGGGGAGEAGNVDGLGHGGDGLEYSISGVASYYAGGGGGGADSSPGVGGQGGGGSGVVYTSATGGVDGTANTGGGGGGGASRTASAPGGHGGSGIVIIRYPL